MPNYDEIEKEFFELMKGGTTTPFDDIRAKYLKAYRDISGRNVICYYSAFLEKPNAAGTSLDLSDLARFMLCADKLEKSQGLDLFLHLPGGAVHAAQTITHYLRGMFGENIRVIVPEFAYSAGTMIACYAKEILMGKHSNLGPADPQWRGLSANNLLRSIDEVEKAIQSNPNISNFWLGMYRGLPPNFIVECRQALTWGRQIVETGLKGAMFKADGDSEAKARAIADHLLNPDTTLDHGRPIQIEEIRKIGMKVVEIEADPKLQDAVLSVHHSFKFSLQFLDVMKIVENHLPQRSMVFIPKVPQT